MKKYLVETYYTCTLKPSMVYELNEKEMSKIDGRDDGELKIEVKLNNRKTKKIGVVMKLKNLRKNLKF